MTLAGAEIRNRVTYHAPSPEGILKHAALSDGFALLMGEIDELVPEGREKALVFTKLEEAKMWASAGVARNPETR
jgi:hypothetical protein